MKISDMKVGQTLKHIGKSRIYTVKYVSNDFFVVDSLAGEQVFGTYTAPNLQPYKSVRG